MNHEKFRLAAVWGRKCCSECLGGDGSWGTGGCFACMHVICQKQVLDLLGLEFQTVISPHVGAGKQTWGPLLGAVCVLNHWATLLATGAVF